MRKLLAWTTVALAVCGISGLLAVYKRHEIEASGAAAAAMPEPKEAVGAVEAHAGQWSASTRAIGTVVALRTIELRNGLAGTISEMGFTSGSIVEAGQLIVHFDTRQKQASLAAAMAEAKIAKQTLERREALRTSAAYSAHEADKARAEFEVASARARGLGAIISKKLLAAPFRARIGITNLQPGAYLDAGTVIARLQGLDSDAYVDFTLSQENAEAVKVGSTVTVTSPALPQRSVTATVMAEDDSADGASRTVRFRAVVHGHGASLRPGTFVDGTAVVSQPAPVVLVPLTAVRRSPAGQHVFVLVKHDGKSRAKLRPVRTGPVDNDNIVVESGLAAGDRIAAAGSFKLRDGVLVETGETQPAADAAAGVN